MQIFAGLGNPGPKYAGNRHNIGFMVLDRIAADHGFSPWKSRFQSEAAEGTVQTASGPVKLLLLKPQTFYNESGRAAGEAARFYKLSPEDVTVFHDEIDLAPGRLKTKAGGGHAGHNGLRSIHQHLGPHYDRVRMGVGHPGHKDAVPGYVLKDFAKADEIWLDDMLRGISDGAAALAAGDDARFLNAVSLRLNPPRSGGGTKGRPAEPQAPETEPAARQDPASAESDRSDDRSALQKLADRFR